MLKRTAAPCPARRPAAARSSGGRGGRRARWPTRRRRRRAGRGRAPTGTAQPKGVERGAVRGLRPRAGAHPGSTRPTSYPATASICASISRSWPAWVVASPAGTSATTARSGGGGDAGGWIAPRRRAASLLDRDPPARAPFRSCIERHRDVRVARRRRGGVGGRAASARYVARSGRGAAYSKRAAVGDAATRSCATQEAASRVCVARGARRGARRAAGKGGGGGGRPRVRRRDEAPGGPRLLAQTLASELARHR